MEGCDVQLKLTKRIDNLLIRVQELEDYVEAIKLTFDEQNQKKLIYFEYVNSLNK